MQSAKQRDAKRSRQRKQARAAGLKLATGDLDTLQAFANTAPRDGRADEIATPERLARWLERRGLLDPGTVLGDAEHRRARQARAAVRALIAAHRGAEVDPAAVERLERSAAGGRLEVRYDERGPAGFGAAGRTFDDAMAALAGIVAAARLEGRWRKMKLCGRPGCRRAFFDTAVNDTGRWCSPQCGDRMRAERRRRRERRRTI